jgi:hypothetical protein
MHCGGRRPKSAKARNRVKWDLGDAAGDLAESWAASKARAIFATRFAPRGRKPARRADGQGFTTAVVTGALVAAFGVLLFLIVW